MQKYEPIVISDLTHLNGKLLIATPYYSFNDIFKKSIIYIMSSKKEYSMGLILNQKISDKYSYPDPDVNLSENFELFLGGPVEPKRCFVIHSGEYSKNILLPEFLRTINTLNFHYLLLGSTAERGESTIKG